MDRLQHGTSESLAQVGQDRRSKKGSLHEVVLPFQVTEYRNLTFDRLNDS